MNTNDVDVSKIEIGDRVLVDNASFVTGELHWGTVLEHSAYISGVRVDMDNPELDRAKHFQLNEGHDYVCYLALYSEVKKHIPAVKVAMHEGRPVNVEDHGQPTVFAAVVSQLHETISYLEQMTGKKFEPTVHSFGLSAEGTYTDNNVTIRFIETKEH